MGKRDYPRNSSSRRCRGAILCCIAPNSAPNWTPATPVSTVSPAMNCVTLRAFPRRSQRSPQGGPFDTHCRAVRAGFPGETFGVLNEKKAKQFGDASRRTRRLGLEAWDRLDSSIVAELELGLCRYRIILLYNTNTAANEPGKTGDRNANQNRTG
jgi:hypothetical protein